MSTGRHEEEKRNAAPASGYLTGGQNTVSTPYAAAQQPKPQPKQEAPKPKPKPQPKQETRKGGSGGGAHQKASTYLTGGRSTEPTPYAAAQSAPRVTAPVLRRATESMSIGDLRRQEYQRAERDDLLQLMANGIQWHMTNDPTERGRLQTANNGIRQRYGMAFDPKTGVTYQGTGDTRKTYRCPRCSSRGRTRWIRGRSTLSRLMTRSSSGTPSCKARSKSCKRNIRICSHGKQGITLARRRRTC